MKLAISQIAWHPDEETGIAEVLVRYGISAVELAPARIFADPSSPTLAEAKSAVDFWSAYGIRPVAFQALLFGRPEMQLFHDKYSRRRTIDFLKSLISVAGDMGIVALVFGSPKNRKILGQTSIAEEFKIARDVFTELGLYATDHGTTFCIEPNPTVYDCNFVTNAAQGAELVIEVGMAGFKLHLDLAGMWLAEDSVASSILDFSSILQHFHLSAPDLGHVVGNGLPYSEAFEALRFSKYDGYASIEMRSVEGSNKSRVEESLSFIASL